LSLISACLSVGLALDDVDEVVDHAPLATHDQVEVAQADVEIDDGDLLAARARPVAMLALVVVLPTPPLPEVTTMISDKGYRDQFGLKVQAVDARRAIAPGPGQGAAAQRTVDMHRAVGDDLGAGADIADNHQVAATRVDLLA
jgi:hypothetical protein